MSEEQERQAGARLARLLKLRRKRSNGRFDLEGGDKTELGLWRTVERFISDERSMSDERC